MSLSPQSLAKIIRRVHLWYPDWQGFDTPRFVEDELAYKWEASKKAQQLLGQKEFERLLQANAIEEIRQRVKKIGHATNLLYLSAPQSGDLRLLYEPSLDKRALVEQIYDLLYGPGDSPDRLQRFVEFLTANKITPYWTFPTYFLFLIHPEADIFVKPRTMKTFFDLVGRSDEWKRKPSGQAYRMILSLARDVWKAFEAYHPRDMIDVQSIMWVAANVSREKQKRLAPPFSQIFASREEAEAGFDFLENTLALLGETSEDASKRISITFPSKYNNHVLRMNYGWWLVVDIRGPKGHDGHGITLALRDDLLAASPWAEAFPKSTTFKTGEDESAFSLYHLPWLLPEAMDEGLRAIYEQSMREIGQRFAHWKASPYRKYHHPDILEAILNPEKRDALFTRGLSPKSLPEHVEEIEGEAIVPDAAFSPRAFELLAGLHENPTRTYFQEHREAFQNEIIDAFKRLMTAVALSLPSAMTDILETEREILGRILKNDYGKGGAWDFFWGAFYPKGSKRTVDAQLSVWLNHQLLEYGFFIGDYGAEQRKRFRRNCQKHPEIITMLRDYMPDWERFVFGQLGQHFTITEAGEVKLLQPGSWEDFFHNPEEFGFDISILWPRYKVLTLPFDKLVEDISRIYQQLFPLVLLATEEDPMPAIMRYLEQEEEDEEIIELNPLYSLEQMAEETGFELALLQRWKRAIQRKGQAILYGPPGTGKTFVAKLLARHLVGGGDGIIDLVQFHPAYAYEDFIQGIRPESDGERLTYPLKPGRFLDFIHRARQRTGASVLIIDEINRANLSRVFGELMYLLEYRDESIPLASGGELRIPPNVFIISTMNTADRSIALVDHALRRRFAFLALWPDYNLLRHFHQRHHTNFPVEGLIQVLRRLNDAIGDRHYAVGISYFLIKNLETQIEDIWCMEIEPYLDEYFFDQPTKAQNFSWERIRDLIWTP